MMSPLSDSRKIHYDIIGDVHRRLNLLENLLLTLGYQNKKASYSHPEGRKALFVGDLINRGPDVLGVLSLVREMHEEGNALVTIGNHEFRVIQELVNFGKIENDKITPHMNWIRSWPLFLELPELRAVHAAWHFSSISKLKNARLDDDGFIAKTLDKTAPEKLAIDRILYGIKVSLPKKIEMVDRFEIQRQKGRVRWWESPSEKSFADYLFSPMYPSPSDLYPKGEEVRKLNLMNSLKNPSSLDIIACPQTSPKSTDRSYVSMAASLVIKFYGPISGMGKKPHYEKSSIISELRFFRFNLQMVLLSSLLS